MSKNIGFRITVEYDCPDMVDESSFHDEYNCNPMDAYKDISDNFSDHPVNFSEAEKVVKVELLRYVKENKTMIENEFKALMYSGIYVDITKLNEGIYQINKPYLLDKEETIETLIQQANLVNETMRSIYCTEKYFENLKQCELVEISVTPIR